MLQADSLPSEPPGKPMNTGVGSLSLLQGILQSQDSNRSGDGYEGLFFSVCFVFNFLLSCKDLELYSVDSRKSAKFSMQGNDTSRFKTQKDNSRNLG